MVWLLLLSGLVLLIFGADMLVKGAAKLAGSFGVPPLVIGLTVVAFGTSAPELAVSVKSAWSGQAELAIANVIGSNIFNILFILGLAALISPLLVSKQLIRQDVPIMIAVSAIATVMVWNGLLERWESAILFLALLAYTGFLFIQGKKQNDEEGIAEIDELLSGNTPTWKSVLYFVIGLILLVLGARWLVQSAISIATGLGVSEAVIGLTIVAVGTSLPEVMTSVMATIRGERDIAIGNVVGSNIFNILCVLGLAGLISPEPLIAGPQLATLDIPVMLAVSVLCLPLFFVGATLTRFEGFLFLLLYTSYVSYMILVVTQANFATTLEQALIYGLIPAVFIYVSFTLVRDLMQQQKK